MIPFRHIPNFERVGGREAVCAWLQWSLDRGMPLQMQMESVTNPLMVRVMGLDLRQNLIRLVGDELESAKDHPQRLNLAGVYTNGSVYLVSGVWQPDHDSVPGEYMVAIPDFVDRLQWREFFRVPTPKNCELRWRDAQGAQRARVLNLSFGGFRIFLPTQALEPEPFPEGYPLNQCEIVAGDVHVPLGTAIVQYRFPDEQDHGWMIGCKFEKEASQQLSRLIMSLQVTSPRAG